MDCWVVHERFRIVWSKSTKVRTHSSSPNAKGLPTRDQRREKSSILQGAEQSRAGWITRLSHYRVHGASTMSEINNVIIIRELGA